jgi:hypothetical protein
VVFICVFFIREQIRKQVFQENYFISSYLWALAPEITLYGHRVYVHTYICWWCTLYNLHQQQNAWETWIVRNILKSADLRAMRNEKPKENISRNLFKETSHFSVFSFTTLKYYSSFKYQKKFHVLSSFWADLPIYGWNDWIWLFSQR